MCRLHRIQLDASHAGDEGRCVGVKNATPSDPCAPRVRALHCTALSGCPSCWVALRGSCRSAGRTAVGLVLMRTRCIALPSTFKRNIMRHVTCNVASNATAFGRDKAQGVSLRPDHPNVRFDSAGVCMRVVCVRASCALEVSVCIARGTSSCNSSVLLVWDGRRVRYRWGSVLSFGFGPYGRTPVRSKPSAVIHHSRLRFDNCVPTAVRSATLCRYDTLLADVSMEVRLLTVQLSY